MSTALFLKELMSLTQALHTSLLTIFTFSAMHATCSTLLCVPIPIELLLRLSPSYLSNVVLLCCYRGIIFRHRTQPFFLRKSTNPKRP